MPAAQSVSVPSSLEFDSAEPSPSVALADANRVSLEGDFSALYATWFEGVLAWISSLGVRGCDKQDVAQSVFVVVHRRLPYCDRRNIGGWLYRITANQVRDYRKQRWNRTNFERLELLLDTIPSPDPTPATVLETREARKMIAGALSGLSESTRATFVLFDLLGFTCDEIAALHRVVPNTVWARLRRARQRVVARLIDSRERERMERFFYDPKQHALAHSPYRMTTQRRSF